jgi:hypothetical protein
MPHEAGNSKPDILKPVGIIFISVYTVSHIMYTDSHCIFIVLGKSRGKRQKAINFVVIDVQRVLEGGPGGGGDYTPTPGPRCLYNKVIHFRVFSGGWSLWYPSCGRFFVNYSIFFVTG